MGVDRGTLLRPPSGSSAMIQMNVSHKDVFDVFRVEAMRLYLSDQCRQGRARPGLHQSKSAIGFHEESSDDARCILKLKVEGVNAHGDLNGDHERHLASAAPCAPRLIS